MTHIRRHGGSRPGAGRPRSQDTVVLRLPVRVAAVARKLKAPPPIGEVGTFLDVAPRSVATIPLVGASVPAGFPSPADDYMDRPLDFNDLLVDNPTATFAVRISGESMVGAGLLPGDIAVVDRSRQPANGCIVLALIDGEFTVKRFRRGAHGVVLEAENPDFKDLVILEGAAFEVWGVVVGSVRRY